MTNLLLSNDHKQRCYSMLAGSTRRPKLDWTYQCVVFATAFLQAALTHRITNRARLEEVARQVVANSTDKLLEVGLDERMVCQTACIKSLARLLPLYSWQILSYMDLY